MSIYGYYNSHGYNSNYHPRADNADGKMVFKNSNYNSQHDFNKDSFNDFRIWVNKFQKAVDEYTEQKYFYEREKELKIEDEDSRREMKLAVSDNKGFLEDMRKAIDWYINNFGIEPDFYKEMVKDFSIELKRLKRLKKYLSYRVRSLAGRRLYNEFSKDMLQYVRIKIGAINILFDPSYNERTPLEDIYGIEEDDDDIYLDDINTNKLFYDYD